MSSLTIGPSYAGGLSQGIADATSGGHDTLFLDPGVYASDTTTSSDGTRGPGRTVKRLTIRPTLGRESIAIDTQTLNGANFIRFLNCRFASALQTAPSTRTLPLFDTSAPCLNAGIKLTPVVSDLPVPRVRFRNPRAASQTESLVVTVESRDITVSGAGTDSTKKITTTASSIIAAINASPEASALVTASVKDGQDGSGHVQGGFPFFEVWSGGWRECSLENGTHHVEFDGCKLGVVRLKENVCSVKVKNCFFPQASFPLTCSLNNGDKTVRDVRFCNNYVYGGYNTDCSGPRPAECDGFWMDDNVFEDSCDPEASALHMDTFQPIFAMRLMVVRRNKFIDQSGQCFFMNDAYFHHVLVENNLIYQNGETNLSCQISGVRTGVFRFNTIIANGWLWALGNAGQLNDSCIVYNNVTERFSRTLTVPVTHDYNIVDTAGTNWISGANETSTMPAFTSPGFPDWDYHFLNGAQPGVGDGTTAFRNLGSPATDLDGNPRDPAVVDQGCFVYTP